MKFGLLLAHTVSVSVPGWAGKWVDYGALKKIIKTIPRRPQAGDSSEGAADAPKEGESSSAVQAAASTQAADVTSAATIPAAAASETPVAAAAPLPQGAALAALLDTVPEEVAFFTTVNTELRKVAAFFCQAEEHFAARYRVLVSSFEQYCLAWVAHHEQGRPPGAPDLRAATQAQLAAVTRLYCAGLQLENYAVINYCALGKILKKHDKATKAATKIPYMQTLVNAQRFAHYHRLQALLEACETVYTLLTGALPPEPVQVPVPPTAPRGGGEPAAASPHAAEAAQLAGLRALQSSAMGHRAKEDEQQHRHRHQVRAEGRGAAGASSASASSVLGRRGRGSAAAAAEAPPGDGARERGAAFVAGYRVSHRLLQRRPSPALAVGEEGEGRDVAEEEEEEAGAGAAKRRRVSRGGRDSAQEEEEEEDGDAGAEGSARAAGARRGSWIRAAARARAKVGVAAARGLHLAGGDSGRDAGAAAHMLLDGAVGRPAAAESSSSSAGDDEDEEDNDEGGDSDSSSFSRGGGYPLRRGAGTSADASPSFGPSSGAPLLASLMQLAAAASHVAGPG